jgi:hypothetical protein
MTTSQSGSLSPVFLLGLHRGGTTFVQRLLNCHRDLVVWGENAGILNDYASMFERLRHAPIEKVDASGFAEFSQHATQFIAWANPFSTKELLEVIAAQINTLYSRSGLISRWGIKEIRYCKSTTLEFLKALYPEAKFLFLVRDPMAIYMSRLHVAWGDLPSNQQACEHAQAFLNEFGGTVATMKQFCAANPRQAVMLEVEQFFEGRIAFARLLQFLDLAPDRYRKDLAEKVRSTRVGSSYSDVGRRIDPRVVEIYRSALRQVVRDYRGLGKGSS